MLWLVALNGWADDLTIGPSSEYATIVEALDAANEGDRLILEPGTHAESLHLFGVKGITLAGSGTSGPNATVVRVQSGGNVWHFDDDSALTVENLVLDGGGSRRPLRVGGKSTTILRQVILTNGSRTAAAGGAALVLGDGVLEMYDSQVLNSTSARAGGGVRCSNAQRCVFEDVVFDNNAGSDGGAISSSGTDTTILRRVNACNNRASDNGGAAFLAVTDATVVNSTFINNAAFSGAGIHVSDATLVAQHNTFVGNLATLDPTSTGSALRLRTNVGALVESTLFVGGRHTYNPSGAFDYFDSLESVTGGFNLYFDNVNADIHPATYLAGAQTGQDPQLGATMTCTAPLPAATSVAIDNGSPNSRDPDGSQADIGATGGPDAHRDRDQDGFIDGIDCDDQDPSVHPDSQEICSLRDDDCDGLVDDADPSLNAEGSGTPAWIDNDGDGYGSEPITVCNEQLPGLADADGDCDDTNIEVGPQQPEVCNDVDDNCDGVIDEGCEDEPPVDRDEPSEPVATSVGTFSGSGCGCAAPSGGSPSSALLIGLMGGLAVLRRRPRQTHNPRYSSSSSSCSGSYSVSE